MELKFEQVEETFRKAVENYDRLNGLTVASSLKLCCDFYDQYRIKGIDPTIPDYDALLFQYGVYDWHDGNGENFQFNFTRQFKLDDEEDEFYQLRLTLYFDAEPFKGLPRVSKWSMECDSLDQWIENLKNSEGYTQTRNDSPNFYKIVCSLT